MVSRQPLLPQEQGLPPRLTTGMWPISAHWPELPSQMFSPIEKEAPIPTSQIIYNQAIIDGIIRSNACGHEVEIEL